jgi:hypothetical protein
MTFLGADRVSVVFIACFCLSPGFVDTKMSAGFGSKLTPAEGTKSIRHCLFEAPKELSGTVSLSTQILIKTSSFGFALISLDCTMSKIAFRITRSMKR